MHLVFATDGIKKEVDDTINQLQGVYLPFEVKEGAAGVEKGNYTAQVQVRPIQLWDVVFPREHKDLMLASILGETPKVNIKKFKADNFFVKILKRKMGLKEIPNYKKDVRIGPRFKHTNVIPIGIKDDYNFKDGTEAL